MVRSIKHRRPIHLLSELEATFYFLIERKRAVIDIREQWPILDIDRTLELAAERGVRHPKKGPFPEPFTIDFLITESEDGAVCHRAASIKTPEDSVDPEIRNRLAVEASWCAEKNVPWTLVDTSRFSKTLLSNLRFMRSWFRHRADIDETGIKKFAEKFHRNFERNVALRVQIDEVAKKLSIPRTLAEDLFRRCLWDGHLSVSMEFPISLTSPVFLNES